MLMEQPSRKAKSTVGEKKGVTPQSVVAEGNAKKPSPDSLQKPGNSSGKPRVSFWIRLKTFTFEPPKKVIVEGDTIRLVPVSSETETTVGEKEISVITEELTAVVVETPGGKGEAESQTLLTPDELVSPLAERAATRDMQWGIPVPAPDADGKVLYVWFDAVLGYISATKQWANAQGHPDAWQQWWKDANTSYTAFLGKDNIVFHTIIFPILLHTRSEEGYILPAEVPANEFLNLEGQKFSKSRNWAIDLVQYLTAFPEAQHVDILRYVLTMNMPETKDSDFTWRDYQARTNNELAAILGYYVNRVVRTRFRR